MSLCFSKRIIQGGLTQGAHCPSLVLHGGGCFIPPAERLRANCHNSKAAPVPSLWSSKQRVMILYLVQHSSLRVFPGGSDGKESSCNAGRPEFDLWLGKIPWRWVVNPLQYSCLGNLTDRGAWLAAVHGVMT